MTDRRSTLPIAVAAVGFMCLIAGLVWDVRLHSADPDLAAEEGVLSLSNPGHALSAVGMVLCGFGLAIAALRAFHRRVVAFFLAAGVAGAVSLAGTVGWTPTEEAHSAGRHRDEAAEEHVLTADPTGDHHESPPVAERVAQATGAQRAAAGALLKETQEAIAKYEDVTVALAEGYVRHTDPRKSLAHYEHRANRTDGAVLDPDRPEALVYRTTPDGGARLLGAMFIVRRGEGLPMTGYPIVNWHSHDEDRCPAFLATPEHPCNDAVRALHIWTSPGAPDPFAHAP